MKKVSFILLVLIFSSKLFSETIVFSADMMTGRAGDSSSSTVLKGNSSVKTDTIEINASSISLSGEDYSKISAQGSIKGINKKSNLEFSCDNLEYNRKTEIILLYGNVNFEDKSNKVTAKAQIIEYNQKTEVATLQVQINLVKDDNTCTGSYAIYNKNEQILELSGNATVTQKDDSFRAQYIRLDLDSQNITLDGNVKGSVKDVKNQEENPSTETEDSTNPPKNPDEENTNPPEERKAENGAIMNPPPPRNLQGNPNE